MQVIKTMFGIFLLLAFTQGCGPRIVAKSAPVDVTLKVSLAGKPVDNVSLTLQPLDNGGQAESKVTKGEWKCSVIPGKYTFYIDKGKSEADLNRVPESYRLGSRERTLDIRESGTFDVVLN